MKAILISKSLSVVFYLFLDDILSMTPRAPTLSGILSAFVFLPFSHLCLKVSPLCLLLKQDLLRVADASQQACKKLEREAEPIGREREGESHSRDEYWCPHYSKFVGDPSQH